MNGDSWFVLKDKKSLPRELRGKEERLIENLPEIEIEIDYRRNVASACKHVLTFPKNCDRFLFLSETSLVCQQLLDLYPLKRPRQVYRDVAMLITNLVEKAGIDLPPMD